MTEKPENEPEGAFDAPQTGPTPEAPEVRIPEAELPVEERDARDPSESPGGAARKTPNIKPPDEQSAGEKEILEGLERAEDDRRREANPPPGGA